ncbi:hypothetical protein NDU88_003361 [Pleurodeles waltl]|uniref:Uncharacterized protein n=1 Tax=Pleurodeles waltl TaxID=8319 RepID=A0AAV7V0G2_PLEWA|nr:hypothetical protein NDU88_003361 [Pleurodeles waltl]
MLGKTEPPLGPWRCHGGTHRTPAVRPEVLSHTRDQFKSSTAAGPKNGPKNDLIGRSHNRRPFWVLQNFAGRDPVAQKCRTHRQREPHCLSTPTNVLSHTRDQFKSSTAAGPKNDLIGRSHNRGRHFGCFKTLRAVILWPRSAELIGKENHTA